MNRQQHEWNGHAHSYNETPNRLMGGNDEYYADGSTDSKPSHWPVRTLVAFASLTLGMALVPFGLLLCSGTGRRARRNRRFVSAVAAFFVPLMAVDPNHIYAMHTEAMTSHAPKGTLLIVAPTDPIPSLHAPQHEQQGPQHRQATISGVPFAPPSAPQPLIEYTYDDNGNLTDRSIDGVVQVTYAYDAENRLVPPRGTLLIVASTATTLLPCQSLQIPQGSLKPNTTISGVPLSPNAIVFYTYDDDGIRRSKSVGGRTIHYTTDKNRPYAQVLEERDADTDTLLVRYVYGHDLISQTRDPEGATPEKRYFFYDGQMSTRTLVDENGDPTDTYTYDAFGNELDSTYTGDAPTENAYRYTGEQYDEDLGQYYLRARYYDQSVGRFTTRDTFGGLRHDPRSLHRYLYAHADPINRRDPSGLFSIAQLQSAQGIQGILVRILVNYNRIKRVYDLINKITDVYRFAQKAARIIRAIADPSGTSLMATLQQSFLGLSLSDANAIWSRFGSMFTCLGSYWEEASKALLAKIPTIAREVASRVAKRIPSYVKAKQRGRLKFVLWGPTAPGFRGSDTSLDLTGDLRLRLGVTGGRLFGFGVHLGGDMYDQLVRIDYWDVRGTGSMKLHYHLIDDPSSGDRVPGTSYLIPRVPGTSYLIPCCSSGIQGHRSILDKSALHSQSPVRLRRVSLYSRQQVKQAKLLRLVEYLVGAYEITRRLFASTSSPRETRRELHPRRPICENNSEADHRKPQTSESHTRGKYPDTQYTPPACAQLAPAKFHSAQ